MVERSSRQEGGDDQVPRWALVRRDAPAVVGGAVIRVLTSNAPTAVELFRDGEQLAAGAYGQQVDDVAAEPSVAADVPTAMRARTAPRETDPDCCSVLFDRRNSARSRRLLARRQRGSAGRLGVPRGLGPSGPLH